MSAQEAFDQVSELQRKVYAGELPDKTREENDHLHAELDRILAPFPAIADSRPNSCGCFRCRARHVIHLLKDNEP